MFADAGFDCWFGNFRGNVYSKRHVQLDPNSHDFWKFSWDQMASKDLPAMIQKVLDITGQDQIYYVGDSMGTLTAFAEFSQNQQLATHVCEQHHTMLQVFVITDQGILRVGTCRQRHSHQRTFPFPRRQLSSN